MSREPLYLYLISILVVSMLAFSIHSVRASGTVYIRADGSIDPPDTLISTFDNITYSFTGNIINESIVVQRDNIVLDGGGFTIQGDGTVNGIDLSNRSNITIKNTEITTFSYGIWLNSSSSSSISGNNITNNEGGIALLSSNYNSISGNTFTNDGLSVSVSYQNSVENNTVNSKPLVYLEGVSNYTVDDAGQVILVRCANIRVRGLSLSRTDNGIILLETSNSSISGNNITANNLFGIWLDSSSNNTLSGNNITANSWEGIWLVSSSNNTLSGNNIAAHTDNGIWLDHSSANALSGNNVANNSHGIELYNSSSDILFGNNVTNNLGGVWLEVSSGNTLSGNNVANNVHGIELGSSSNNTLSGNNAANNEYGIYLENSGNNTLCGNNVTGNTQYGVYLAYLSGNTFYHNNLMANTQQVTNIKSANVWDNGCEGNYWSDYNGTDLDNDGVGDTFLPWEGVDNYPLTNVYRNPCDINHDLEVNRTDIDISARAFGTHLGEALWNPHADITGPEPFVPDGKVDMRDIGLIAKHYGERYQ